MSSETQNDEEFRKVKLLQKKSLNTRRNLFDIRLDVEQKIEGFSWQKKRQIVH
jgi:hypothetical protein